MAISAIAAVAAKEVVVHAAREAATQAAREIAQKMAAESATQTAGHEIQASVMERQAVQDGFRVGEMSDAKGEGREIFKEKESDAADELRDKLDAEQAQSDVGAISETEPLELQNAIETETSTGTEVQEMVQSKEAIETGELIKAQEGVETSESVANAEWTEGRESLREMIKSETGWSDEIVDSIRNEGEYGVYKKADLKEGTVSGKQSLQLEIDPSYTDDFGRTNVERMQHGLSPYDAKSGEKIELHHMGQKVDSPFAELRENIDHGDGNHHVLHDLKSESWRRDPGSVADYANQRTEYWKARAEQLVAA